jgi:hypothetical protein
VKVFSIFSSDSLRAAHMEIMNRVRFAILDADDMISYSYVVLNF